MPGPSETLPVIEQRLAERLLDLMTSPDARGLVASVLAVVERKAGRQSARLPQGERKSVGMGVAPPHHRRRTLGLKAKRLGFRRNDFYTIDADNKAHPIRADRYRTVIGRFHSSQ